VGRRLLRGLALPIALIAFGSAASAGSAGNNAQPAVNDTLGVSQAFVIGNGNAAVGNRVTFWGSQWWKNNLLSVAGAPLDTTAPAAFKGFAMQLDPNAPLCGPFMSFTTAPGNSSDPPAGPLPGQMTVLIASQVIQTGSTITGTVTGYAVVATDPGYDGNPGHPGTGTVLSVTDCGAVL
jgi:hypothetical protein